MLEVQDALHAILNHAQLLPTSTVEISDALDTVLAETLSTPHDSPPFDKSMMDGFAVDSETVFSGHRGPLRVEETITAGTVPSHPMGTGVAARIMTGAPLPPQADCVIPVEHVQFDESRPNVVEIESEWVHAERHVLRQGASAAAGSVLLEQGTQLKPRHIALLAEFGLARVPVVSRPRVAVLATGDELVPATADLTPGRIRNSNQPMLEAQIHRASAIPMPLGIARDERSELSSRIQQGLKNDVLLLSGGVSAGTLDLVPSELQAAGVQEVFHKIRMKPGKPLWFGTLTSADHTCLVLGLPGNPVSSMVCFEVFVRPLLEQLSGRLPSASRNRTATLTDDITIRGDRLTYFPSVIRQTETGLSATPVAWGGSADLRSTSHANGVCCLPPSDQPYRAGALVNVLRWDTL